MTNNLDLKYLENALSGFETILCDINAFSRTVADNKASFGDTLTVPYLTHTSASNAFSYTTGYQNDHTSIVGKDVTLNNLLYRSCLVADNSYAKLTTANLEETFRGMGEALARDVISASFSACLTETNFPTSASAVQNELTSSIGLSALVKQGDDLNWTEQRSLILSPSAFQYVLQNPSVNQSYAYGGSDPVQTGKVNNLFGFSANKYNGVFPTLDQPAKGIVCDTSAILFGFGVHRPADTAQGLVNMLSASSKGVVLTLKTFYDANVASTKFVLESVFGCTVGNSTGLVWLK